MPGDVVIRPGADDDAVTTACGRLRISCTWNDQRLKGTRSAGILSRLGESIVGPRHSPRTITHVSRLCGIADHPVTGRLGSLQRLTGGSRTKSAVSVDSRSPSVVAQVVGPALDRISAGSRVVVYLSPRGRASRAVSSSLISLASIHSCSASWCAQAYGLAKTANSLTTRNGTSCCRERATAGTGRSPAASERLSAEGSSPCRVKWLPAGGAVLCVPR